MFVSAASLHAVGTKAWIGGDGDWGVGTNWNPSGVPTGTDIIYLGTSSGTQAQINGDRVIGGLEFSDLSPTAVNWTMNSGVGSSSLTLTGSITHTATKSLRFYSLNGSSLDMDIGSITMSGSGGDTILGGGTGGNLNNALGTLTLGSVQATNNNSLILLTTGTATLGDVTLTNGSSLLVYNSAGGGSGGATVTSLTGGSGDAKVGASNNSSANGVGTLTINATGSATFSGHLYDNTLYSSSATLALVKTGTGKQTLSGASYNTGGTLVSQGTLVVANTVGSGLGFGAVTVQSGGVLGGTGFVRLREANSTTVNSGGVVAAGDEGIGTLTFDGGGSTGPSLVMESGARFAVDLGAGDTSDTIAFWNYVAGDFVLNNTAIDFTGAEEGTYTLFTFYSNDGTTITASGISSGIDLENSTGLAGYNAQVNYGTNTITLTLTTIPEPQAFSLPAALAAVLLLARHRRRQAKAA